MADRAEMTLARHARHDPLRVAEAVDRGGRLAPVMQFCDPCGRLYADLLALTAAIPLGALPSRPRDFTLRADDARRLRTAVWRAWWRAIGSARDAVTRPLAIGFTTLGLAGLLLTATSTLLPTAGSAAASPEFDRILSTGGAEPMAPTTIDPDAPAAPNGDPIQAAVADPTSIPGLSVGLLAAGGSLFAARRIAARRARMR